MKIFLGFDFYGAGNIGDDLMLAGFLECTQNKPFDIGCIIPFPLESQRKRFPQVEWYNYEGVKRKEIISHYDVWLGAGGTPFQITSGSWLLDKLQAEVKMLKVMNKPVFMVCVGSETEAYQKKEQIKEIVGNIDLIWTRDLMSKEFLLKECAVFEEKVLASDDLANIALERIFQNRDEGSREQKIAINFYSENIDQWDIDILKEFIIETHNTKKVTLFANETRLKRYEYSIYRKLFNPLSQIFNGDVPAVYMPDYTKDTTAELVNHFENYDVVLSSRYHAILTAAWAGCKVVGIGRSSKIDDLAKELDIHCITQPFSRNKLSEALNLAKRVDRDVLKLKAQKAKRSVDQFLNTINKRYS